MERGGAGTGALVCVQQHPLSDFALGGCAASGRSCAGAHRAAAFQRFAGQIRAPHPPAGTELSEIAWPQARAEGGADRHRQTFVDTSRFAGTYYRPAN